MLQAIQPNDLELDVLRERIMIDLGFPGHMRDRAVEAMQAKSPQQGKPVKREIKVPEHTLRRLQRHSISFAIPCQRRILLRSHVDNQRSCIEFNVQAHVNSSAKPPRNSRPDVLSLSICLPHAFITKALLTEIAERSRGDVYAEARRRGAKVAIYPRRNRRPRTTATACVGGSAW